MENFYIVYVKVNSNSYITAVNSSAFLTDTEGWMKIDSGYGDKYHHAQNHYFPERIVTDKGLYRYKMIYDTPAECTAEELAEQEQKNKPVPKAPVNVVAGGYITLDNVLYKATTNIPNGEEIIVGQNAVVTTIEQELYELKGE